MANGPGKVTETPQSYKTTGTNNVPSGAGATVSPANNADLSSANTRYVHDAIDVSGFVGTSQEYHTYADNRNKPL